jgi:hypothetical protein
MMERYLIGNRLFKFLSVVLPTHQDYFSPELKLAQLRVNSQNQLIELLEYMEELELMIDEMEYNSYILTDLTPPMTRKTNKKKNKVNNTKNTTGSRSDETWTTFQQNMSQSSLEEEEEEAETMEIIHPEYQQILGKKRESRNTSTSLDGCTEESTHTTRQSNHSRKSLRTQYSDDFAQRVAAVVVAHHDNDAFTTTSPPPTQRSMSYISDQSTYFQNQQQHSNTKPSDNNKSISTITEMPPPIYPTTSSLVIRKKKMKKGSRDEACENTDHHSLESWGNSTIGDFSDPFTTFELHATVSHIDLLMGDEPDSTSLKAPNRRHQNKTEGLPRIPARGKQSGIVALPPPKLKHHPPAVNPELHTGAVANPNTEDNVSTYAGSDFSSGMVFSLEDQSGMTGISYQNLTPLVEFRSKIEQRLERAAEIRKQQMSMCDLSQCDNSSVVDFRPYGERRLKCQFRGCIRSILH